MGCGRLEYKMCLYISSMGALYEKQAITSRGYILYPIPEWYIFDQYIGEHQSNETCPRTFISCWPWIFFDITKILCRIYPRF